MSKDILGSLLRVLVTVPENRLGLIHDISRKLSGNDGDSWEAQLKSFLRKEPCWVVAPFQPTTLSVKIAQDQLLEWTALYKKLGITLNPEEVKIPARREGFNRLILVPKGMTAQRAFDLCTTRFAARKYTIQSLDKTVSTNDRDATNGTYTLWIRDRVEADEELKSKSADDLTEANIKGITLTERLLYELKYHQETGKHLDLKNHTMCSGSRSPIGYVPHVYWCDDWLFVFWYCAHSRDSHLRSRAVSL